MSYKYTIAILAQKFNSELERTLDSIFELNNIKDCEVVLVDNGSTTPLSSQISDSKYPNIVHIRHNTDTGYCVGKNSAVEAASGEYVLLLDDDIVLPNSTYLKDILEAYTVHPKIAFLGLLLVDENKLVTRYHGMQYTWYGLDFFRKSLSLEQVKLKNNSQIDSFHGGAVFFKKDVWNKLGGYDTYQPIMHDDFDISARAMRFGYSNYLYSLVPAIHIGKFKDLDKKRFAKKYKYFYSGLVGSIVKNFPLWQVPFRILFFSTFSLGLMLALVYKKRNVYVFFAFLYSYYFFIMKSVYLIQERTRLSKTLGRHD